jgi:hypothetical protein
LSTTIDKPKWIENNPKGDSLLPSFATMSLDATLLFPETKSYPAAFPFSLDLLFFEIY